MGKVRGTHESLEVVAEKLLQEVGFGTIVLTAATSIALSFSSIFATAEASITIALAIGSPILERKHARAILRLWATSGPGLPRQAVLITVQGVSPDAVEPELRKRPVAAFDDEELASPLELAEARAKGEGLELVVELASWL